MNTLSRLIVAVVFIFAVVRVTFAVIRFTSRDEKPKESIDISPYLMTIEEAKKIEADRLKNIVNQDKIVQNILYLHYVDLDAFTAVQKENYGLYKLERDSILFINFKTQIKIPKGYYCKNNNVDSLAVACKSPDNLNVFIYNFKTKDNFEKSVSDLRKRNNWEKYQVEDTVGLTKSISYKITRSKDNFTGFALYFKRSQQGVFTFFEFESNKLSKKELKNVSMDFLSRNLKQDNLN